MITHTFLFAQTNFYKLSVGAGAGPAAAFADLDDHTFSFAAYATADYYMTPYITVGIEIQKGELAGGNINTERNRRQFINSYLSGTGNIKFALGEMLTSYQLKSQLIYNLRGLYAGVGFGYIKNKVSNVIYDGKNVYPGADSSLENLVSFNVGINFYFPDQWEHTRFTLNLNLQHSIAIGEGLDGYYATGAKHNDMYTYATAGIKCHFGSFGLDKRR